MAPVVLFFIGTVIAIVVAGWRAAQTRTAAAWKAAAAELGLEYEPPSAFGYPKLRGRMGVSDVTVDTISSGGNNNQRLTRISVSFTGPRDLAVSRENVLTRIGAIFGIDDVAVGDPAFDNTYRISGDAEAIRRWLTPDRREVIDRLFTTFPGLEMKDGALRVLRRGVENDTERMVSVVRRLVSAARDLSEPSPDVAAAREQRRRGDLQAAADAFRTVVHAHPDDIELLVEHAETRHAAGDSAGAKDSLDEAARLAPQDPEVLGWLDRVSAPATESPPPESTSIVDESLTPEAVGEALFAENRLSFETDALFAERFAGTRVRWSGKVRRATRFEVDPDFGVGPGLKVVAAVATIDSDLYGQTEIHAVFALPPDVAVARDQTITFEGMLSRIDALMRNLLLEDVRLV